MSAENTTPPAGEQAETMAATYEAGVWEQGRGLVVWSAHRTEEAAHWAARRYARRLATSGPRTGGARSWSGGYRRQGGPTTWEARP